MEHYIYNQEVMQRTRRYFLTKRRYTATEVYRMRELMKATETAVANVQSLLDNLYKCRLKGPLPQKIQEEVTHLLFVSQSLEQMTRKNKALENAFILEIVGTKRKVADLLGITCQLLRLTSEGLRCGRD